MAFSKPILWHPMLFAPDLDPSTPGIILDADGMYPTLTGVRVLPSLVAQSNTLAGILEAFTGQQSAGAVRTFAATASHIYQLSAGVWVECDGSQTFSALSWSFDQSGDDT